MNHLAIDDLEPCPTCHEWVSGEDREDCDVCDETGTIEVNEETEAVLAK